MYTDESGHLCSATRGGYSIITKDTVILGLFRKVLEIITTQNITSGTLQSGESYLYFS